MQSHSEHDGFGRSTQTGFDAGILIRQAWLVQQVLHDHSYGRNGQNHLAGY